MSVTSDTVPSGGFGYINNVLEWIARLDPQVLLVGFAALGVLIALPLELVALGRLRHLRLASGTVYLLLGGFIVLVCVALGLAAASLHTYRRLTHEQQAANVSIRQIGERHYALTLDAPPAPARHFEMRGDEWQIDARVLKWRGIGSLAGFDTVYRLERLSGRYAELSQERRAPRTVYALTQEKGMDFWPVVRRYHDYLPFADALYGAAAYVPLAENAAYAVTVSSSGLVVRPANDAARKAVGAWR
ncbi:MAG TPA: hypothetical protein VET51_10855 [Burkholderiales bacterium]|nr:hypothetical protein [Burkholderiales bacterium]